MIGAALLRLARSPLGRRAAGFVFAHMTFLLPVHRLRDTETLIAFHHPKPSYPVHILLVPKKAVASLAELDPTDAFMPELIRTVQALVSELGLESRDYRLIVNGGAFQDVAQLHFHLIAEKG